MAVVPRIPDDPNGKTIPIAWRLFHQWFVSRYQGDPKGAFTVYLEGSPEGRVKAPVGSVALRTSAPGAQAYVKETGNESTGWVVGVQHPARSRAAGWVRSCGRTSGPRRLSVAVLG